MARLIDADELMKSIEDNSYPVSQKHNSIEKGMTLTGIKQCIKDCTAVYAEPVRRGKWIEAQGIIGIDPETLDVKIGNVDRCSLCSTEFVSVPVKYKYCPNCGSIMRGDDYGKK